VACIFGQGAPSELASQRHCCVARHRRHIPHPRTRAARFHPRTHPPTTLARRIAIPVSVATPQRIAAIPNSCEKQGRHRAFLFGTGSGNSTFPASPQPPLTAALRLPACQFVSSCQGNPSTVNPARQGRGRPCITSFAIDPQRSAIVVVAPYPVHPLCQRAHCHCSALCSAPVSVAAAATSSLVFSAPPRAFTSLHRLLVFVQAPAWQIARQLLRLPRPQQLAPCS